ncbi:MAG TPA: trigger factor [Gammaproteobacteria bacterium]|nr:trigger factor [Gammaproteobacteria bacterium]
MKVSVESLSKVEKRLKVIIPSQQVEQALDEQLHVFAKTAEVKGFRPGKVPLPYIKQRFGQEVRNEAISSLIQKTLNEAIRQEKLYPISTPRVETNKSLSQSDLEYTATFDILPEIAEVQFNTDNLEKWTASITEKDIEQTLERVREQNVLWNKVERPAQENDKISGKIHILTEEGQAFTPEPLPLEFVLKNEPSIFGWNLIEKLAGAEVGQEKKFSHTLPTESFLQGMGGKTLEFSIEIVAVFEQSLPPLDEAFAKKLGIQSGDLTELRSEIRKQLELNLKRTTRSLLKNRVFEKLIEQNPLDLPQSLIDREAKLLHDENCSHQGGGAHQHSKTDELQFSMIAKKRIHLGLLVGELAAKGKLNPSPERVNEYLAEFASVYADSEEYIRRVQADKNQLKEIETFVLEDQIVEKLLENVSIVEKEVSYEKLIKQADLTQEKNSTITQEGA